MKIWDWFRGQSSSSFLGDGDLHQSCISRLASLNVEFNQVLINLSEDELNHLWNIHTGVHDEMVGPGLARSFVAQLRTSISIDMHRSTVPADCRVDQSTPLAGALDHLAEAACRLRRRRRPYDRDVESSEDDSFFDLGSILDSYQSARGSMKSIPASCFGDLRRLQQLFARADRRSDKRIPFMAQSAVEEWTPSWVGADLGRDRRSALVKQRSRDLGSKGLAPFLSNVITFLLSHLAIRQVDLASILAYVTILCKLSEERSLAVAIRYHYYLHNHMADRFRIGERHSIDHYISVEQDFILRRIESRAPPRTVPPRRDLPDDVPARQLTDTPNRNPRAPKFSRKLICFRHRPHENVKCSDAECLRLREHLDTSKPELLERFQRAQQAADSKKKRKSELPSNQSR